MAPRTQGMEFATEMIANASKENLKITEVPITLYPDKRLGKPHLRSFRDGWRHLRYILTYAPDYVYLAPGVTLLTVGTVLQYLLVGGPIRINGLYMGIHFLALGCLLSLLGTSIITTGIFAKMIDSVNRKTARSGLTKWMFDSFRVEYGLIAGVFLAVVGGCIDAWLLYRWSFDGSPMEQTIHLVFVATSLIAIGVNFIFSTFLANLIAREHSKNIS